jgi:16S rRNA processing protein RimM
MPLLLTVGRIVRPHGVRGEVVVDVRTDEPESRFAVGATLVTEGGGPPALTIESVRPHQGRLLVVFDGVYDREVADQLRGVRLCVDSADLPAPSDPDEFHDHQLVGLRAVTPLGAELGEVVRVDHVPASDLLVLRRPDGASALVPFVKAIVPSVDLPGGRIVVDPPGGLFDL